MRLLNTLFLISLSLLLLACGRSKQPNYYVLNPMYINSAVHSRSPHLLIGLDGVNLPSYLNKPGFFVHYTPHFLSLHETDQWAEPLDKNIKRILVANLAALLPGAAVAASPWDPQFSPNLHVQVNINNLQMNQQGSSLLDADFFIFNHDKLIEKRHVYYCLRNSQAQPLTMVQSINANINHLSRDIAARLRRG